MFVIQLLTVICFRSRCGEIVVDIFSELSAIFISKTDQNGGFFLFIDRNGV